MAPPARPPAHPASPRRRRLLRDGGLLVLSLGAAELVRGATLLAVRVWPAEDYTRITLESDRPLAHRHFHVAGPDRLVIELPGLALSPLLRELAGKVRPDDPYIAGVRLGQPTPEAVRLVLDLKQPAAPQVFGLEPVAAYGHRLVFDLFPAVERDPLLSLLAERGLHHPPGAASAPAAPASAPAGGAGARAQAAARAVDDALGEFIGRMQARGPEPAAGPQAAARPQPGAGPASAAAPPLASAGLAPARPAGLRAEAAALAERLTIVALDPGHGGEDPGAIGPTGLMEKDVVLKVGLMLRERLDRRGDLRAFLTRDADFFVPLHERVRKARRVQADLFVSIHADAFIRREARGASVYVLSESGASSSAARWLAQKENDADRIGGVNLRQHDPNLNRVLLDMSTAAQIKDSLKLGSEVLRHMGRIGRLHKPQVEQAGFAVLKAPDIPSILVETAFISNPEEEALLRDPAYLGRVVEALATGIERHFAQHPPRGREPTL